MTTEHWQKVKEVYDEVAAHESAQWPVRLNFACPNDAAVRAEVEQLLELQARVGEFQVAVKLVWPGFDSAEIFKRFRQERHILAELDHPNIARLLDGGTTGEGWSYVVMEYVDGEPLTQYCNQHKLSVTERLRLFQQVCAAVS